MKRKILSLKLQDEIPCSEIRKSTKIIDITEYTLKPKWRWVGHVARMDNKIGSYAAQSRNQGEGRDHEDDHAEDGKTT